MTQRALPTTARFVARSTPKLSASSPTSAAVASAVAYAAVRASGR